MSWWLKNRKLWKFTIPSMFVMAMALLQIAAMFFEAEQRHQQREAKARQERAQFIEQKIMPVFRKPRREAADAKQAALDRERQAEAEEVVLP